jgi:hypothetical protein
MFILQQNKHTIHELNQKIQKYTNKFRIVFNLGFVRVMGGSTGFDRVEKSRGSASDGGWHGSGDERRTPATNGEGESARNERELG